MNPSAAAGFASLLEEAIAMRGVNPNRLAEALGCTRQNINEIRKRGRVPGPALAARLAEALDEPRLLEYAIRARQFKCRTCGQTSVALTVKKQYCSTQCWRIGYTLKGRRGGLTRTEVGLRAELEAMRQAVAEMCHGCEPDGICRTSDCSLRSVSPWPLVLIQPVSIKPAPGWSDERRAAASARMKADWATNYDARRRAVTAGARAKRKAA